MARTDSRNDPALSSFRLRENGAAMAANAPAARAATRRGRRRFFNPSPGQVDGRRSYR